MIKVLRGFTTLLMMVSLLGCTTAQTIANSRVPTDPHKLQPGDMVSLLLKSGVIYNVRVISVRAGDLTGYDGARDKTWKIAFNQIARIGPGTTIEQDDAAGRGISYVFLGMLLGAAALAGTIAVVTH
jgi:hypothetical protein